MFGKKWAALLAVVVTVSMLLTACAPATPQIIEKVVKETVVVKEQVKETVVVEQTKVVEKQVVITPTPAPTIKPKRPNIIKVNTGGVGDVPTLDPNISEDTTSITVVEDSFVGLTRLDEVTSALHPGMATKWDISADGKTYTFTLRKDVPWVKYNVTKKAVEKVASCPDKDGKTADRLVTAKDFEYGIRRALNPELASPYAYVLGFVIQGAQDVIDGKLPYTDTEKLGVKAIDDWTLELKFIEPAAYNANIAGLWTAMATPKWIIEGDDCTTGRSDRWTEAGFFQSFGPFTLKEWIHDSTLTMIKNPFWPGDEWTPKAKVDEVVFSMLDEAAAFAQFEAGNLDAAAVPSADLDRVKADAKLSKLLVIAPSTCTYYYGFNTTAAFVSDVRVRQALSLAVDRKALVENVLKGGQEPAQWFTRPGMAGGPTIADHPDLGVKLDVAKANSLLDAYLKEKSLTKDKLDISLMFNTSSGHQKIAEAVQQMWKTNLGINVKLTNQEWAVYLKTTKSLDTPQLFRMGWCMDYPDANNWVREVCAAGGSQNPVDQAGKPAGGFMWKNDKFETLVKQAAAELDPKKRVELYAQAEQILVYDDPAMIPLYWYTRVTTTQPWIKRTFSVGGHERYEHWEVLQQ